MLSHPFISTHLVAIIYSSLSLAAVLPASAAIEKDYFKEHLIFEKGHIKQLKTFDQNSYEAAPPEIVKKPSILEGESGLCGLLSLYNGLCLMNALEASSQEEQKAWLKKMSSIESFHEWVDENEAAFEYVKQERGRIGFINNLDVKRVARNVVDDEHFKRINAFGFASIKKPGEIYFEYGEFAEKFNRSFFKQIPKSLLIVFRLGTVDHSIAVVFSPTTTWIIDPCNLNWTTDFSVRGLDRFMRQDSPSEYLTLSALEKISAASFSTLRTILEKAWKLMPFASSPLARTT